MISQLNLTYLSRVSNPALNNHRITVHCPNANRRLPIANTIKLTIYNIPLSAVRLISFKDAVRSIHWNRILCSSLHLPSNSVPSNLSATARSHWRPSAANPSPSALLCSLPLSNLSPTSWLNANHAHERPRAGRSCAAARPHRAFALTPTREGHGTAPL